MENGNGNNGRNDRLDRHAIALYRNNNNATYVALEAHGIRDEDGIFGGGVGAECTALVLYI